MTSAEMRAFMKGLERSGGNWKAIVKAAKIHPERYQLFRRERVDFTSEEVEALETALIDAGLLEAEE